MTEINIMQHDVYNTLRHLDEWMAPEKRPTNLFNIPAWSQASHTHICRSGHRGTILRITFPPPLPSLAR